MILISRLICVPQPRGSTFPMLEGPSSQEGSVEEDQECVITPSTSVKFSAALKERNRVNYMRNYLLLIGILELITSINNYISYVRQDYLLFGDGNPVSWLSYG